jgi:L-seryl-tRNA(Ser) seleniumtransferase
MDNDPGPVLHSSVVVRDPSLLRLLPKVDDLLRRREIAQLLEAHPRALVLEAIGTTIDGLRREILAGGVGGEALRSRVEAAIPAEVVDAVRRADRRGLRRVVNATGVVLHTGLGRAPLAPEAARAAADALAGYCLLEVDAETGRRGRREAFVADLLRRLLGAEGATVVNNNAGAVLLALAALAEGKEVVVSRGELVEIGGAFRMPDVMRRGGAHLVEVGTTNRTYLDDYRGALGERTGALLKVHRSNFRLEGFVHDVEIEDLCALGRERGIAVIHDLGSGLVSAEGLDALAAEPLVSRSVRAGADLVTFSGDKLFAGPQAGVIVGRREAVERARSHPLFRALRLDKGTLAALEATVRIHLAGEETARERLPVLRMLSAPIEEIEARARALADRLRAALPSTVSVAVEEDVSRAGSGSAPQTPIPTRVVALRDPAAGPDSWLRALRSHDPPVFARIREDRVVLDPRTLLPGDEEVLVAAVAVAAAREAKGSR